ncbi:MAG: L-threonylcarbamoyladenylate synthase [Candidatus Nanopelagicales bacterium]
MNHVEILSASEVNKAVTYLANGGLVAIPTETVYGLGALINQPEALARIFDVKSRPKNHPLIVHVSNWEMALPLIASKFPAYVSELVEAFSPGPITYILPKSELISDVITGGQDSVGIRIPSHPVAQSILQTLGVAIAAPSANTFGGVSPTSALHVFTDLGSLLKEEHDAILDGGECDIGIESTIVDCRFDIPKVLRPGAITEAMIHSVVSSIQTESATDIRVSGSLEKHYSPYARVRIIDSVDEIGSDIALAGFIANEAIPTPRETIRLAMPKDDEEFARVLYAALRRADELHLEDVFVIAPLGSGIGSAIRDRLLRASH